MVSILTSKNGKLTSLTIQELFALRNNKAEYAKTSFWIDLDNPSQEEEETILLHFFFFHELTIEDIQRERLEPRRGDHYPKVEDYNDYLFAILNPLIIPKNLPGSKYFETEDIPLEDLGLLFPTQQVNVYIGANYLVTHHYEQNSAIDYVIDYLKRNSHSLERGPDYIFHSILDEIVENYTPVLEYYDIQMERVETEIFENLESVTLERILEIKKGLIRLRKIMAYQREILNRLSRGEFRHISKTEMLYYRNVYDHLVRIADLLETYRENISGLLEIYMSVTSQKMNQVMKVLTVISTIFLPLTFISSIYGMNFDFMPELRWEYGYFIILAFLLTIALGMLGYFRKKGWLE